MFLQLQNLPFSLTWWKKQSHLIRSLRACRYTLPCKPVLTLAGLGGLGDFAELSSRYKGSHVKIMLWWFAKRSQEAADGSDDVDLQVLAACAWGLQRSTELQSASGMIMLPQDADEACDALLLFTTTFSWLALRFESQGFLFKVRPKLHYLVHMAWDLKNLRINQCRVFATNLEESFLGRIKLIAQQVHGRTLTQRIFQRYVLTLAVSINQFRGWSERPVLEKKGSSWTQAIACMATWLDGSKHSCWQNRFWQSTVFTCLYIYFIQKTVYETRGFPRTMVFHSKNFHTAQGPNNLAKLLFVNVLPCLGSYRTCLVVIYVLFLPCSIWQWCLKLVEIHIERSRHHMVSQHRTVQAYFTYIHACL